VLTSYSTLIANKMIGVQPLPGPTGLIYYVRNRYSSASLDEVASDERRKKPKIWRDLSDPWEPSHLQKQDS
jgi:hypothetical protein